MEIWRKTTMHGLYCKTRCHGQAGFTMLELITAMVVLSILAAFALPNIIDWLPNYRLKSAARDLVSNIQKARMEAVRGNTDVVMTFDGSVNPGFYFFDTDKGENRIDFSSYGSDVDYGTGNAALNWNGDACVQAPSITFNSRGTSNAGTIYIKNQDNDICYAITARSSGSIKLRKYNGALPFNKNNWN
jgi:type IV fimbrial biogenesis protein FimT